ncbi:MAG TPA: response regulator transcription factor, partial [Polyangiales bacterium]|nr:response regulator transcription factor [Polyangiales bacterium]
TPNATPRARKVLLIEDDLEFTQNISPMLEEAALAVERVASRSAALAALQRFAPDVALVDLSLPDCDGTELIRDLCRERAGMPVVVVTQISDEARILSAIRAGAAGYVFKADVGQRVVQVIEEAMRGGAPLSRPVARLLLRVYRGGMPASAQAPALTRRERSVLAMLAEGKSYAEVGEKLGVSENTVRSHVRSIYEKLGVSSKTEAVMAGLRLGLVRVT